MVSNWSCCHYKSPYNIYSTDVKLPLLVDTQHNIFSWYKQCLHYLMLLHCNVHCHVSRSSSVSRELLTISLYLLLDVDIQNYKCFTFLNYIVVVFFFLFFIQFHSLFLYFWCWCRIHGIAAFVVVIIIIGELFCVHIKYPKESSTECFMFILLKYDNLRELNIVLCYIPTTIPLLPPMLK